MHEVAAVGTSRPSEDGHNGLFQRNARFLKVTGTMTDMEAMTAPTKEI